MKNLSRSSQTRLFITITLAIILCGCTLPWGGEEEMEFSFLPAPIYDLKPQTYGGDDPDFVDDGPHVVASAKLDISGGKEVYVILRLMGEQTAPYYRDTWAEGMWVYKLWTVPSPNCTIVEILTSDSSYVEYTDNGWGLDTFEPMYGSLASKFEFEADTDGADVGPTGFPYFFMNIYFNQVRIKVKVEQD